MINSRFNNIQNFFKSHKNIIAGLMLSLYFFIYIFYTWRSHINLQTYLFDLGLQEQTIWNTSEGRWFQSSPGVTNFLGDHFSPLLLPVALLYKIFPSTMTLFVIQTLAIILGIFAFYKLSRNKLKTEWLHWLILLSMLSYWPLSGALTFPFHEICLAFPLLAWGIYFLETSRKDQTKKTILGIALLFTAMLAKEDVGIFVGMLGLYYLFFRNKKWGAYIFVTGLIWSLLALFVFIPFFRESASDTLERYAYLGKSFQEIFHSIFNRNKLLYLLKLFIPVLPILTYLPQAILLIGPSLSVNLFSNSVQMTSVDKQYDVILSAGLFFLNIMAWQKLENTNNNKITKKIKYLGIIFACLYLLMLIFHPLWYKFSNIEDRSKDYQYIQTIETDIPKKAKISISNSLGAQFAQFQNLYLFDPPWIKQKYDADYILIDLKEYSGWKDMSQDSNYMLLSKNGNIEVYQRISL